MRSLDAECLRCGARRTIGRGLRHREGECLRCGYVGWAPSDKLDEKTRRRLRERPLERRRLHAA